MKKFSSRSPNTFAKLSVHDKLQRNVRSMHDVSQGNNYTGTTAFLLERIENCTSNPQRFNPKIFETKRINIMSDSNVLNKGNEVQSNAGIEIENGKVLRYCKGDTKNTVGASNTVGANMVGTNNSVGANNTVCANKTARANSMVNDYEKFIGHSSEQYKIKPLLHWRNLQNSPRDIENGKNKTDVCLKATESQGVPLLPRHNIPNLEPKNVELKNGANLVKSKDGLNNVPSERIGIAEKLSVLINPPVLDVNEKPLKVLDRDSVKRRLFVSELCNTFNMNSANNAGPSVINEPKANSAAEQIKFDDSHEPANSDTVKELTKNLTKILHIKELDNIKMDFVDSSENKQQIALQDEVNQKVEQTGVEIANLTESFEENGLKDKDDNKLLPKAVTNDVALEINVYGLSDMMKDIIFETTKVANVEKDEVITENSADGEMKPEEDVISLQNDKLNLTLENVESIAEDVTEVEDNVVKANNGEQERDVEKIEVILNDDSQSSLSSEKISANKANAINNNDSVQGIRSDAIIHTPPVAECITEEKNSESIEDAAISIEDVERFVEDVAPTQEKDVANDTVLSEELLVPSSIEMSSGQSPISAPHVSDDNESFWN